MGKKFDKEKIDFIHGESFPDGIMFNNDSFLSISYKKSNGNIKDEIIKKDSIFKKYPKLKYLILIRGLINFFEGSINQLIASSKIYKKEKINTYSAFLSVILILLGGYILYFLLPMGFVYYIQRYDLNYNQLYLTEAIGRFIIFLIVFIGLSFTKNAKKTAYYHGAEHKILMCYLNKEKITLENVKKYPIFNPACGTSLIFLLLLISIPVFYFLSYEKIFFRIIIMLILLPILIGLSFDIIDFLGKRRIKKKFRTKGFFLQRFNTKNPTDDHIKISILSLENLLKNS